jgi:hypothetical protein
MMALSNPVMPLTGSRPGPRRLSSLTATERDIKEGGPVIIVPERMMAQRSQSHNSSFAASLETARSELAAIGLEEEDMLSPSSSSPEISSSPETSSSPEIATSPETSSSPETSGSPFTPADVLTTDAFAFAFDIDGVLVRGGKPIPEAVEAMKVLNGENEYGMKVQVIFFTFEEPC